MEIGILEIMAYRIDTERYSKAKRVNEINGVETRVARKAERSNEIKWCGTRVARYAMSPFSYPSPQLLTSRTDSSNILCQTKIMQSRSGNDINSTLGIRSRNQQLQ